MHSHRASGAAAPIGFSASALAPETNAGASINAVCASAIARYDRSMSNERMRAVEEAITRHLRASGEPVREAFLYERVREDGVEVSGDDFIAVLLRLEVGGHLRVDPVHDDRAADPEPFAPRYWRITE
jgi:hypothetical protein